MVYAVTFFYSTVGINGATCRDAEYSYAAVTVSVIYFIIFIVMSAFVLFSLFVGIVTTSMNKATAKMQAPGTRTHKQTHKHTNTKVQEEDTPLGIHPPPPGGYSADDTRGAYATARGCGWYLRLRPCSLNSKLSGCNR
jgi:hypothetical protein